MHAHTLSLSVSVSVSVSLSLSLSLSLSILKNAHIQAKRLYYGWLAVLRLTGVRYCQLFRAGRASSVGRVSDWKASCNIQWRGFESTVRQEMFLPQSTSSADSLTVPVQPPCAIARITICAHFKNPKHWQPCIYIPDVLTHEDTANTGRNW